MGKAHFDVQRIYSSRKFIAVDNYAAVKVWDLEKETKC